MERTQDAFLFRFLFARLCVHTNCNKTLNLVPLAAVRDMRAGHGVMLQVT